MLSNHIKRYIRTCHTFDASDAVDRNVIVEDILPRLRQLRLEMAQGLWAARRRQIGFLDGDLKRALEEVVTLKEAIRAATRSLASD
ncbi:hypothetical protein [Cupriavidus sp. TMH.W2]|uniref:hypothetical protein n=1 Tax=Cupriavidus sp. TMH.W2 TaxID=3434465 RepID=UPI003D781F19